jgi:putative endonuclease
MNTYYVYILTNKRKTTLYIGVTNDIRRRMYEHKNHLLPGFTDRYNLEWLIYIEETSEIHAAISREKQLKAWSRSKKNTLIESTNPAWLDLSAEWVTKDTPQTAMERVERDFSLRSK